MQILAIALWPIVACATDDSGGSSTTVERPHYYQNRYFAFSLLYPVDWAVLHQATEHEFLAAGGNALVHDKVLSRDTVAADQANTTTLLKIAEPLETSMRFRSSITFTSEGLHEGAPFKTASDYVDHTAHLMTSMTTVRSTVAEPTREVTLGGPSFYRTEIESQLSDGHVLTYFYAQFIKGYAFSITVSAGDKNQLAKADRIVHDVLFSRK